MRNKDFTGREQLLTQLHDALNRKEGGDERVTAVVSDVQEPTVSAANVPQAIQGMGGVGKTQVAVEYAHRYQDEYDLVWWISADQPKLVAAALAGLSEPLQLTARSTGISETAQAVLDALRRGEPYGRWLLIYDNADRPEDISGLIPGGDGHVLITSRNQAWKNRFSTIAVDVFSRNESVAFLSRRVPEAITEDDASRLADSLGDLPLALEQAGALQSETGMSVDDYLQALKEQPAATLSESHPAEYPRPMTLAWQLSLSQLQEQLPAAVDLLRACAFFGPEPIPVDVFRRRIQRTSPRLDEILSSTIPRARALRTLGRFALARIDSKARTIQVHRLIQALLREAVDDQTAAEFRNDVHLLLAAAAPVNPYEDEQWDRFEELVPHVEPARVMDSPHPAVREFSRKMVRYLYRAGDYDLALSFADQALTRWRDSRESELDVLVMESLRAQILRERGLYAEAYEIGQDLVRRTDGAPAAIDQQDVLSIINSFGADLRARGEFRRALDHDESSVARHAEVFGEDDVRTQRAVNNLALDYGLNSQYQRSRELHERALVIQSEATAGVGRADVLLSWYNLSRAVRLCGDYQEARDVGRDAYDYGLRYMKPEHLVMLRTSKDLSIALRRAGEYDNSLTLAKEVYDRFTLLYGPDNPDTLAAAMGLANILRTTGKIGEAYDLAQDTVRRYPRVYGEEHPYNQGCIGNLALLSRVSGNLREARRLNEGALAGLRERLGDDHHYTLTVATNLATDYYEMGDTERARQVGEETLERLRPLLGDDHPMTLGCAANLTVDLRETGAAEKADQLFETTLAAYERTLGPKHPDTVVARKQRRLDFDFDPPPI
ncbi:FxSxx-COOH system tetratricopeptide repeat protein [Spirillospora sp. NPDC047279]|uniref:FxSxx-COOH system tetratricopeptide repeat protein n=1 Tax=Spirillospora sp. NPDC047279 TaxID=3155478 RepID=UPI0033F19391